MHYVGWNTRYDEVVPLSSSRIEEWQSGVESSGAALSSTGKTHLNATAVPCGSEGATARESAGHASGGSGNRLQCSREAVSEGAWGFYLMPLVDSFIRCSGCEEKCHPETLCVGVEERVIFVLVEDMVGAVNFCCCECRMVSGVGCIGAVNDVSAGYAQLLHVVGCLVNEVHSLKDCKIAACRDQGVTSDKQMVGLNKDVNLSRDAIFNEVATRGK